MPINSVVQLINAIDDSKNLRQALNSLSDPVEVTDYLNNMGYPFTPNEFEDAIRMLHLRCQSEEEASLLMIKVMWLRYLLRLEEN